MSYSARTTNAAAMTPRMVRMQLSNCILCAWGGCSVVCDIVPSVRANDSFYALCRFVANLPAVWWGTNPKCSWGGQNTQLKHAYPTSVKKLQRSVGVMVY